MLIKDMALKRRDPSGRCERCRVELWCVEEERESLNGTGLHSARYKNGACGKCEFVLLFSQQKLHYFPTSPMCACAKLLRSPMFHRHVILGLVCVVPIRGMVDKRAPLLQIIRKNKTMN